MTRNRFHDEAKVVRANHDASALMEYIESTFEPVDEIPPSKVTKPDNYIRDFPVDLDARITAMEVRLGHEEAREQHDLQRYNTIRTTGLAALTDMEIMFHGSGDPRRAINSPMLILHSHLASFKVMLPRYRELLAQWKLERALAGEQLQMF